MKVIKEAIVGEYHWILSSDYLAITLDGKEMVHMKSDEAVEVIQWINNELWGHRPQGLALNVPVPLKPVAMPNKEEVVTYDPGARSFNQGSGPLPSIAKTTQSNTLPPSGPQIVHA